MRTLVAAAIAWPLLLGSVVWARQDGRQPLWTTMVYVVGSKICHQRPERSFHTGGVQWPVCARCAGLYASAPFGAVIALIATGRSRRRGLWVGGSGVRRFEGSQVPGFRSSGSAGSEPSTTEPRNPRTSEPPNPRTQAPLSAWIIFIATSIPTAITLLVEWPGLAAPSNLVRAVTALPLGASIAFLIVRVAGGRDPIG